MNKLLAGVVCLSVVAIISTSAIQVGELTEVLGDKLGGQLKEQCGRPVPLLLDEALIVPAYIKFFRVFYDQPRMLAGQLKNYNKFLDDLAQAGDDEMRRQVVHAHSLVVCKSLESLVATIAE